jgi:FkbM family methyltransferase
MKPILEPLRKAVVYPAKLSATLAPTQMMAFVHAYVVNRSPIRIRTRAFPTPVWLRPRSTDIRVAYELFTKRELEMRWPLARPPRTIIDGGANVGYASMALKRRWPDAYVLAIEPDAANFAMLRKNCAELNAFDSLQCGIWGSACTLCVRPESTDSAWGLQFEPVSPGTAGGIAGRTMRTLLSLLPGQHSDLLKLEIEGAELDVFSDEHLDWIDRVAVILIEPHGEAARDVVTSVAAAREFQIDPVGEKLMMWRKAAA